MSKAVIPQYEFVTPIDDEHDYSGRLVNFPDKPGMASHKIGKIENHESSLEQVSLPIQVKEQIYGNTYPPDR